MAYYCALQQILLRTNMTTQSGYEFSKEMLESGMASMQKFYDSNSSYYTECFTLGQAAQERYLDTKTLSEMVEVQREYAKGLWNATKTVYKTNSDLVKDSYSESSAFMKKMFEDIPKKETASTSKTASTDVELV